MRQQLPAISYGRWVSRYLCRRFAPGYPIDKPKDLGWMENLFGPRRILARTRPGFFVACDQTDWLQRNLLCNRQHEPEVTDLLVRTLRPEDIFFDVGANCGYFSLLAAHRGCRRVVAFEPDAELCDVIRFNARINGDVSGIIDVRQVALSDSCGESEFERATDSGVSGFGHWPHRKPLESVRVSMQTLDQIALNLRPTVIKIDVEGWESAVVAGAADLLRAHPPRLIVFEAEPDDEMQPGDGRLKDVFRSAGYRISHLARYTGQIKNTENFLADHLGQTGEAPSE